MPESVKRDFLWGGVLEGDEARTLYLLHIFLFTVFSKNLIYTYRKAHERYKLLNKCKVLECGNFPDHKLAPLF